jgi:hypothetical protein
MDCRIVRGEEIVSLIWGFVYKSSLDTKSAIDSSREHGPENTLGSSRNQKHGKPIAFVYNSRCRKLIGLGQQTLGDEGRL